MGFIKKVFGLILFLAIMVGVGYGGYVYGQVSLKDNLFKVDIPINETFSFPIKQEVNFPVNELIVIPINESFPIKEVIPISVNIPINTIVKIPMNMSGKIIYVDAPINTSIPIKTDIKIDKNILVSKNVEFRFEKNVSILIEKEILVPIDGTFTTDIPVPDWIRRK